MSGTKRGRVNFIWGIICVALIVLVGVMIIFGGKDDPSKKPPTNKEILTASQAETIMATATQKHYAHGKIKEVTKMSILGMDVETTDIYTSTGVYEKSVLMGTYEDEFWVKKDGNDWYKYYLEETEFIIGGESTIETSYLKSAVTMENDDARYFIDDSEDDPAENLEEQFVEAYIQNGVTTIIYKYYNAETGAEVRTIYTIKNGERVKAELKGYDDSMASFLTLSIVEYFYDDAVTDVVPPLPTLPTGEVWELDDEVI